MKSILASLITTFTRETRLSEDEKYVLNFAAEIITSHSPVQSGRWFHLQHSKEVHGYILTAVSAQGVETALLDEEDILDALIVIKYYPVSESYEYEDCEYSHLKEIPFKQIDLLILAAYAKNKKLFVCS